MKPVSIDFGIVIAFIAPGFVALLAVSYYIPAAGQLVAAAANEHQDVGVFLIVLLSSLSIGLVISGVRLIVIDSLILHVRPKCLRVQNYHVNYKAVDRDTLSKILTLRDNFYRFYQFYANSVVALLFWLAAQQWAPPPAKNLPREGVIIVLSHSSSCSRLATSSAGIQRPLTISWARKIWTKLYPRVTGAISRLCVEGAPPTR